MIAVELGYGPWQTDKMPRNVLRRAVAGRQNQIMICAVK